MTLLASEIQSLSPTALLEMFVLDMTAAGGPILHFHAGTNQLSQPLVWQGQTYTPLPIEAEGFDLTTQGTLPRPKMRIANVQGLFSAEVMQYDDLLGCKVIRKRTFARFIDQQNFASWQGYGLVVSSAAGTATVANTQDLGNLAFVLDDPTQGVLGTDILANQSAVQLEGAFSIEGFYNFSSFANKNILSGANWTSGPGIGWVLYVDALGSVHFALSNSGVEVVAAVSPPGMFAPGFAVHICGRYDGTKLMLSVGGKFVASAPYSASVNHGNLINITGSAPETSSFIANQVRLYSRVLTDAEIGAHATSRDYFDDTALWGAWTFDQTLSDFSGNIRNAAVASAQYAPIVDANPTADPTQQYDDDIWYIEQKKAENRYVIEWELASAFDLQGVQLPGRQIRQNSCGWQYRRWNTATSSFDYSNTSECGYTGTSYFDSNDNPVNDPSKDICPKFLSSCKKRFVNVPVPFGGFPGSVRYGN